MCFLVLKYLEHCFLVECLQPKQYNSLFSYQTAGQLSTLMICLSSWKYLLLVVVTVVKVKEGQYATGNGISYLEVKHLMLLSYCECIVFYLLLKAEAISVRNHPVISRLVEIKLFLEKVGIPFRHDSNPVVASFSKDSVSKILSTCISWS